MHTPSTALTDPWRTPDAPSKPKEITEDVTLTDEEGDPCGTTTISYYMAHGTAIVTDKGETTPDDLYWHFWDKKLNWYNDF